MLRSLLRIVTSILLVAVIVARFGFPALLASDISSMYLVEQANLERHKRNLSPLKYNEKLEKAAFLKAENMFKEQYWAHYGPNSESPWQFILQAGYSYTYAGENLAKGFSTSQGVHDAWMASPTHRANILDSQFSEVGIAVVKGNLLGSEVYLVVQMFGNTTFDTSDTSSSSDPFVKITSPDNGDILKDGIKDVRGTVGNIDTDSGVTIYIDDQFQGQANLEDNDFIMNLPGDYGYGEKEILARAKGNGNVLLLDSVNVTFTSSSSSANSITSECFQIANKNLSNIEIGYYCGNYNNLRADYNNATYEISNDKITIPTSVINNNLDISFFVSDNNGNTTRIDTSLSSLGYEDSTQEETRVTLGTVNFRQVVQILFILSALIFILYIIELIRKKEILLHKHELMSFAMLIGILFITFNFGYIRL